MLMLDCRKQCGHGVYTGGPYRGIHEYGDNGHFLGTVYEHIECPKDGEAGAD